MDVSSAVRQRHSVRAFLPSVPPAPLVQSLLQDSARAASGGNVQPWRVLALTGEPLRAVIAAVTAAKPEEGQGNDSYPPDLWDPYRTRRYAVGEDLYGVLGIAHEDKPARLRQMAQNLRFFGAPVGIFICVDERMGLAQWLDLGIYAQSLMLLAVQRGLASCPQGFWRRYDSTLRDVLRLPAHYRVALGVALGYEDTAAPVNTLRSTRADWAEWGELRGF
jgi:nitroreductase